MEEINIWAFNIHTHEGVQRQVEVFDFCKENEIIGTGWGIER